MVRLTILGPEGRQEVELQPHNTIGRHPNNTIQVLDRIISKEHCHIDLVSGQFVLRDLGSLNGSYVNGDRVGERALMPGDEISLGSTRLIYDLEGAKQSSTHRTAPQTPGARIDGARPSNPDPPRYSNPGTPPRPSDRTGPHLAVGPMGSTAQDPAALAPAMVPPPMGKGERLSIPEARNIPKSFGSMTRVTIAPNLVESHIRSKLAPLEHSFLPEKMVTDSDALRRDYEKLRISYELARTIGVELDAGRVLQKILDAAFHLLPADRGVILLFDDAGQLQPRCVRTRRGDENSEQVLISSTIVEQVLKERSAVLSHDATVDSRFGGAHSIIMQGIRSSMAVPLIHNQDLFGIMLLDSQIATSAFTEKDLQLFQNVANQAAISIQNSLYARKLEQEAVTRQKFQRLLSPAIAQQVIEGRVEIQKGGENRQTTVLFSDIRGFTSMSESANPQAIVDMLNEYFELMVEVIFKYEGTLDKFVGDEIMALFGAPVSNPDDPIRAVRTALEMMSVLAELNGVRRSRNEPEVHIGIGINSGDCVAGYLGSSKALEYTVIGDTVNTGARLCSAAKAGQIIISEHTLARLESRFDVAELPPAALKGKSLSLRIFEVLGEKP